MGALGTGQALWNEETWFGEGSSFSHLVKGMNRKSPLFHKSLCLKVPISMSCGLGASEKSPWLGFHVLLFSVFCFLVASLMPYGIVQYRSNVSCVGAGRLRPSWLCSSVTF